MTTLQLAQRLTRNLTHTDVRTLPADELQRIIDAMNTGLGEYVELLPDLRRAEPKTLRLAMALNKTVTATQDSAAVAFTPAFAGQVDYLGCSVVLASDTARFNRLAAPDTLQSAQYGATGSTTMTLYQDALQFDQQDDSIIGPVSLADGNARVELTFGRPLRWSGLEPTIVEMGRPLYWWTEPFNGMRGLNEPLFLIRVWPVPVAAYDLNFRVRLFPAAVSFADIDTPRQMPVPAAEESHLVNLCMPGMFSSPLWNADVKKNDCMADYARAKGAMEVKLARRGNNQSGKFGTRRGY